MPSDRINVYRIHATSRSRSTGRRRSRSPRQRSRSLRRRRERFTARRSTSRRRRRHRRNDEPPRGWVGTQETPRIWRGPNLMPSAGRVQEQRPSASFLTSVSGSRFQFQGFLEFQEFGGGPVWCLQLVKLENRGIQKASLFDFQVLMFWGFLVVDKQVKVQMYNFTDQVNVWIIFQIVACDWCWGTEQPLTIWGGAS